MPFCCHSCRKTTRKTAERQHDVPTQNHEKYMFSLGKTYIFDVRQSPVASGNDKQSAATHREKNVLLEGAKTSKFLKKALKNSACVRPRKKTAPEALLASIFVGSCPYLGPKYSRRLARSGPGSVTWRRFCDPRLVGGMSRGEHLKKKV